MKICPYTLTDKPCRELQPCYMTPECPFYMGARPMEMPRPTDPTYYTHYVLDGPSTATPLPRPIEVTC